jgi:cytochrome c biogenesis protein CcmG, thiol:disulfide interchange protein DsbE
MRTAAAFSVRLIASAAILLVSTFSQADTASLDQFRGKIVVVDFWASWCGPCRQSFPWLNSIAHKYRDKGLVVVGVNVDRERKDADRFLQEVGADFPIIYDPSGALASQYQVAGMPSSFVLAPDGHVLAKHVGFKNSARVERESELEQALASAKVQ